MSISTDRSPGDPPTAGMNYEDTVVTNHRGERRLVVDDAVGSDLNTDGGDVGRFYEGRAAYGRFEPNTQIAELVAIERQFSFLYYEPKATQADREALAGAAFAEYQTLGRGVWNQNDEYDDKDYSGNPSFSGGDADDADYVSHTNRSGIWGGHLLETADVITTPFNDGGDGLGGGGSYSAASPLYMKNFRERFGRGPIFTSPSTDDGVVCNGEIHWTEIDQGTIRAKVVDTMYWDIWELERPLEEIKLRDI